MAALAQEKVWVDKKNYDDAERNYYEKIAKPENATDHPVSPKNKRKNKKDKRNRNTNSVSDTEKNEPATTEVNTPNTKGDNPKVEEEPTKVENPTSVTALPKIEIKSDPPKEKQGKNKGKKNKNAPKEEAKEQQPKPVAEEKTEIIPDSTEVKDIIVAPVENTLEINVQKNNEGGVLPTSSLASEVAKARQHIKNSLECMESVAALAGIPNPELLNKIASLEKENVTLKKTINDLRNLVIDIQKRVDTLEKKPAGSTTTPAAAKPSAKSAAKEDSDDGVDLFASDDDEESATAAKVREERLAAYNAKKAKKPVLIAKSNIILDVKPWDDETDMKAMEAAVRNIKMDGLLWGAAKLAPLAYGIHKLQISCVVEDDKVSVDELTEELEKLEDYVQSVDIAAFNKV